MIYKENFLLQKTMASLLVFVYGTLKIAQPNYHILANKENGFSEFLAKGSTSQKYPLVIGENHKIRKISFKNS